jgi:hypothetical protein
VEPVDDTVVFEVDTVTDVTVIVISSVSVE